MYYIGKGAKEWKGFRGSTNMRGAERDMATNLIKSGTDFRDLSEAILEFEDTPPQSVRRKVITRIVGTHHEITPETPTSVEVDNLVKSLLSTVSDTLSKPVCLSFTPFDVRSEKVRTEETAIGNWVADIIMNAYAEKLDNLDKEKHGEDSRGPEADAVIICGGTFRGDSLYPAGKITLGDILEILPFDDPIVCVEVSLACQPHTSLYKAEEVENKQLDGQGVHDVLESALSKWPAQEG